VAYVQIDVATAKRQSKIASPLSASVSIEKSGYRCRSMRKMIHSLRRTCPRLKAIERVVERVQCQDNPDFWSELTTMAYSVSSREHRNRIFGRRRSGNSQVAERGRDGVVL